jgi:hypothetical protein
MGDAESYRFTFTREISELDRARREWMKVSGMRRRQIRSGLVLVAAGLVEFWASFQLRQEGGSLIFFVLGAMALAFGVGLLTGAWFSFVFRQQLRRYPALTSDRTGLISPSEVLIGAPGIDIRLEWSAIGQVVVLDDMVVIGLKGQPQFHYFPCRGLDSEDQWPGLVHLLAAREQQNSMTTGP